MPALDAQQAQLRVVIVEGEDALNNTLAAANRDVTVEVRGPDQMPVSGATVTFVLPDTGPSGTFPNGQRTLLVETNNQGRATAAGIRPNNVAGPMQIRVSAAYLGNVATATVRQTNVSVAGAEPAKPAPAKDTATAGPRPPPAATTPAPGKPGMSRKTKLVLVIAIIGGAAAGGIAAGSRGGSTSSTPATPPIVITPGTPTVGGQ
jgi:hypothetical protein